MKKIITVTGKGRKTRIVPVGRMAHAAVERWLRDEVVPVHDAMKANPERKISAKSILSEVRARYGAKRKARR